MKFKDNGVVVPPAVGKPFSKVLGLEGDNELSAKAAVFDITVPNLMARYTLPGGETALTLAIMRAGTLTSYSDGNTTVSIPLLSELGFTRTNDSVDLFFRYQILGKGALFINRRAGLPPITILWNNKAPQYLPRYSMGTVVFSGFEEGTGNELWVGV